MLKLISGALVGGTKYSDINVTSDIKDDDTYCKQQKIK